MLLSVAPSMRLEVHWPSAVASAGLNRAPRSEPPADFGDFDALAAPLAPGSLLPPPWPTGPGDDAAAASAATARTPVTYATNYEVDTTWQ